MTATTNHFEQARLRKAVTMSFGENLCVLRHRDVEYEIDIDPDTRKDSIRLLKILSEGNTSFDEIKRQVPTIAEQVGDICDDLDRYGLLTETEYERREVKSGAQFYVELRRLADRARQRYSKGWFFKGLKDGTISKNQMIGYALEYYHVVKMCPALLAPSLSYYDTPNTNRILQSFFVSELNHDRMLAKSLAAVGIESSALDRLVPLPMTHSVCLTLGNNARQHPLMFKAALFLFEESNGEFNQAFCLHAEKLDLPKAFYKPILDHAMINDDGHHEDISRELLAEVPGVSEEEELTVSRNICILVESMAIMERQIVDYYGKASNPIPRLAD